MARFGFVGPSYRSQSVLADCQTCMNFYPESIESGLGKSAFALYPTPGLNALWNLGPAPVRGLLTTQGRTFCVAGTVLWELLPPSTAINKINRGAVVSDGKPVSLAAGGNQILIASAGNAYVYNLAANTLGTTDPSAEAGLPIAMVGFADSFFFALVENQLPVPWQINSSNSFDATTWQGIAETEVVEVFDSNPNCIFFNQRLMWVFGPTGIQPYGDAGDFPFPYDVIPGTYIENGLAAPFSVAKLDNSIFWLGADARGNGMVWRANGFTPQRVSNHAIEFALQSYSTISDAVAYSYQDQGHSFYLLHFPTADKTWVYDVATGMWHERGFWNEKEGKFNRHRAAFHTFNFGIHIVGDYTTGVCYQMAINIYSDFGNPIRRVRRAPHISKEQEYTFHQRLQVDVEVGLGPVPPLQGNAAPTFLYLADPTGKLWTIGVSDEGIPVAKQNGIEGPYPLVLQDPATNSFWQVGITALGQITLTAIAPVSNFQPAVKMVSNTGKTIWTLTARQVGAGFAQLVTNPIGIVGRGPLMMLRWSNDGGQSWSNIHSRDCGQAGQFKTRVLWNRLGRARDRVYEVSVSDAVPWRIIDAYLLADGYEPSERINKQLAKQA